MNAPVTRNVETALSLPGIHVELVTFAQPEPFTGVFEGDDRHALSMSLTPLVTRSRGAYLDANGQPGGWNQVGDVNFCPAGRHLLVSAPVVVSFRSIRLCYTPEFVAATIGSLEHWTPSQWLAALDLQSPAIKRDLFRVVKEVSESGRFREPLIASVARIVLVEMARLVDEERLRSPQVAHSALAPWQMRRIRDYVEGMIDHAPSIDELARVCEIGSRHLMRAFKSTTGRTLGDYIGEVRMTKARSLLADTGLPQKEIASRLGYSGPSAFCVAFGKAVGMTPKQFRDQHRQS